MARLFLAVAALAIALPAVPAADGPVPAPFRAFVVYDRRTEYKSDKEHDPKNKTGRMHDFITENGLNPTVAVFARTTPGAADAPAAKLAQKLSALVGDRRADRLGAFVSFLTLAKEYPDDDQRAEKAGLVLKLAEATKADNVPFTLAGALSEQVKAFNLDEKNDITVVFYDRMAVKQTWTFAADKPPTDADTQGIVAAVNAALGKKK